MSILNQKTINKEILFEGIGLHTGNKVRMKLLPAEPNTGIIFKRTDLKENNIVLPSIFNVTDATFCTTISNEKGVKVSTIEHLMGSLHCLGVDNLVVEVDNQEIPILDGSAKIFVEKIRKVGLKSSNQPIKIIKINNKLSIKEGVKNASIEPSKISLDVDFEIKYENEFIGNQRNKLKVYEDDLTNILNSRTFCLFEDIEKLKKLNLAKGGSLENAIVVKGTKLLNEEGLRNSNEFVNHKILDCLGDMYLCGYKIIGKFKCSQGGHNLTNKILRKVFENKENYSIVEIKGKYLPHLILNKTQLKSIA